MAYSKRSYNFMLKAKYGDVTKWGFVYPANGKAQLLKNLLNSSEVYLFKLKKQRQIQLSADNANGANGAKKTRPMKTICFYRDLALADDNDWQKLVEHINGKWTQGSTLGQQCLVNGQNFTCDFFVDKDQKQKIEQKLTSVKFTVFDTESKLKAAFLLAGTKTVGTDAPYASAAKEQTYYWVPASASNVFGHFKPGQNDCSWDEIQGDLQQFAKFPGKIKEDMHLIVHFQSLAIDLGPFNTETVFKLHHNDTTNTQSRKREYIWTANWGGKCTGGYQDRNLNIGPCQMKWVGNFQTHTGGIFKHVTGGYTGFPSTIFEQEFLKKIKSSQNSKDHKRRFKTVFTCSKWYNSKGKVVKKLKQLDIGMYLEYDPDKSRNSNTAKEIAGGKKRVCDVKKDSIYPYFRNTGRRGFGGDWILDEDSCVLKCNDTMENCYIPFGYGSEKVIRSYNVSDSASIKGIHLRQSECSDTVWSIVSQKIAAAKTI